MMGLKSRLSSLPHIRRSAWAAGEMVHRRLGDGRPERHDGSAADGRSRIPDVTSYGPTVPSYPYSETERDPVWLSPAPGNPILRASDVTDYGDPEFVADPFLFPKESGGWWLFFEVFNRDRRPTGVIGAATSDDGRRWRYHGVVLAADTHLAFPYVFRWEGRFYMIPDRWNRERPAAIRLYRTDDLPGGWRPISTVVTPDRQLADCVVFRWDGRWWAMLGSDDGRYELHLYHAEELTEEEWTPHESNPVIVGRPRGSRPAGRPIVREDRILVFVQDCAVRYGDKVRAFEVERLTPSEYADREVPESPVLKAPDSQFGWNSGQMHHLDAWHTEDGWWCAVDGNIGFGRGAFGPDHWAIGLYRG